MDQNGCMNWKQALNRLGLLVLLAFATVPTAEVVGKTFLASYEVIGLNARGDLAERCKSTPGCTDLKIWVERTKTGGASVRLNFNGDIKQAGRAQLESRARQLASGSLTRSDLQITFEKEGSLQ